MTGEITLSPGQEFETTPQATREMTRQALHRGNQRGLMVPSQINLCDLIFRKLPPVMSSFSISVSYLSPSKETWAFLGFHGTSTGHTRSRSSQRSNNSAWRHLQNESSWGRRS